MDTEQNTPEPATSLEKLLDLNVLSALDDALQKMRAAKPTDRSERARAWAITITELEKAIAYFDRYVVRG